MLVPADGPSIACSVVDLLPFLLLLRRGAVEGAGVGDGSAILGRSLATL